MAGFYFIVPFGENKLSLHKRKTLHEFSLKVLNIGGYTGQYGYIYNDKLQAVEKLSITGIVPNISYKIQF